MKHGILFLNMPIRKVLEWPRLLFPEKSAKCFRRETEGEAEFTVRGEYAAVHISPDCSKYVFELESVCCCKLRIRPCEQASNCFAIAIFHTDHEAEEAKLEEHRGYIAAQRAANRGPPLSARVHLNRRVSAFIVFD